MSKRTFLPIKLSDIHAVRLKNACGSTHPWWKGTCGLSCNPKGKFCSYLIRIFSFHGLPSWWYLLYCSKSLVFIFLFLLSCYKILYKKRKKRTRIHHCLENYVAWCLWRSVKTNIYVDEVLPNVFTFSMLIIYCNL